MKNKKLAQKLSFVTSHKFFNLLTLLLLVFNISAPFFLAPTVSAGNISPSGLISLTNQARSSAGLTTLSYNSKLASAACAKASDMLAKDYWSHFGPNGETPWQFIKAAGYGYLYAGENLGKGFSSDSSLFNAWMASSSHKANIMKPEFRDIGICAKDGVLLGEQVTLVVQMFGALPGSQTTQTNSQVTSSSKSTTVVTNVTSKTTVTTKKAVITTKSVTSVAPIIIKDTTAPDKPIITTPQSGTITNNDKFQIQGNAEKGSIVQVFQDQNKLGQSIAQNGIWTYDPTANFQEGQINLIANATDSSNNVSPNSDLVSITLDKTAPIIDQNSFQISAKVSCENCSLYDANIKITDNIKLAEVKASFDNLEFKTINLDLLSFQVKLDSNSDLAITATDVAGNNSKTTISNSDIKVKILEFEKKNTLLLPSVNLENSTDISAANIAQQIGLDLTDLVKRIGSLNFQHKVNLFFVVILLGLFLLDGTIVYSGGIVTNRSKSGNHFSKLFLILILLLFS